MKNNNAELVFNVVKNAYKFGGDVTFCELRDNLKTTITSARLKALFESSPVKINYVISDVPCKGYPKKFVHIDDIVWTLLQLEKSSGKKLGAKQLVGLAK